MAEGAQRVLGADVAISVTGVAGPDEMEGQPVGTVWYGIAIPGHPTEAITARLPFDRERIRQFSTIPSSTCSGCACSPSPERPARRARSRGAAGASWPLDQVAESRGGNVAASVDARHAGLEADGVAGSLEELCQSGLEGA